MDTNELQAIRERDQASGVTWFTGPASFTAQAARDRRALLVELAYHLEQRGFKPPPAEVVAMSAIVGPVGVLIAQAVWSATWWLRRWL